MLKNKFPLDLQRVSKKYADAYLTTKEATDDEVLSVHRVLMANLSSKLGELFEENRSRKDERIVVRNVRFEILSAIVDFVYTGQIDVEHKGAEFIEDFMDGLNMLKIEIGEKASRKLAEELRKSKESEKVRKAKEIEDAKELRELERKLEMLKKRNDLAEMGRKRIASDDENLNKKKYMWDKVTALRASKTTEMSGDGMTSVPSSHLKPDYRELKESRRNRSVENGRRRSRDGVKVKQERQESWEPSDAEESCDIRSVQHDKQKQEAKDKTRGSLSTSKRSASKIKSFTTWESAAVKIAGSRLRTAPDSQDRRSYEVKSRDGERFSRSDCDGERKMWGKRGRVEGKWEDAERGHKWLRWNFDPIRNPGPDPNWPSEVQVTTFASTISSSRNSNANRGIYMIVQKRKCE